MNSFIAIELSTVLYEWVQTHPITGKPHLDQKLITIAITLITGYATLTLTRLGRVLGNLFSFCSGWFQSSNLKTVEILDSIDKEDKHSIILTKMYGENEQDQKVDSLLDFISELCNIKSLGYQDMMYLLNFYDYFKLNEDIRCRLLKIEYTEAQKLSTVKLIVSSNTKNVQNLRNFIDSIQDDYLRKIQNKLGNKTYFFDLIPSPKKNKKSTTYRGDVSNGPFLTFTKNVFTTTRSFNNIYFEQKDIVRKRTEFFVKRADWYRDKGIPYTLGFMFYGPPGCGKTSTIKAIANYTKRHIVNISLDEIRTKTQLKNLFFNEEIATRNKNTPGNHLENFKIPINQRLYVIEDIDCMSELVFDREDKDKSEDIFAHPFRLGSVGASHPRPIFASDTGPVPAQSGSGTGVPWRNTSLEISPKVASINPVVVEKGNEQDEEDDKITLSSLLNILDGTLEVPGRIIIITSNYPERLDKALIRPGRIDMHVHFKKFSKGMLKEMIEGFYDIKIMLKQLEGYQDYKYSPAEIHAILFRNMNSPEIAIKELIAPLPEDSLSHQEIAPE